MTFLDENTDGDDSEARQDAEQRDSVQSKKLKIKEIIICDVTVNTYPLHAARLYGCVCKVKDRHIDPSAEMNKAFENTSMLIMS